MSVLTERSVGAPGRLRAAFESPLARWCSLALFFSVAAIVQTWPLITHVTDHIQDSDKLPFDTYAFIWSLWWVKAALLDLSNPFHTDFLYYPQGADLYLHTIPIVNGVLSIPLQMATGNLFFSWNVLALLFFVFSGLAMYALSYRVNQNHAGALVSGYIFAFFPYLFMQFNSRWHISAIWPIPLFVLFLIRFHEGSRLRDAVIAAVFWTLLTYNNLEFTMDAAVLLGLFSVYWTVVYLLRRDRERLVTLARGVAVMGVVWFALSSPVLIPTYVRVESGEYALTDEDEYYSADALAFVTPSPLWGPGKDPSPGGSGAHSHQEIGTMENTLYLGIMPLLLAAAALFAIRRTPHRVFFWALVFLVFLILTCGPWLYVDGSKDVSIFGLSFSIPMPYQLYDAVPVMGQRRIPTRLLVFATLGLSVLAGAGVDVVTSWLRRHVRPLAAAAGLIILAIVALEYWNPPVHLSRLPEDPIFEQIRDEPGDFSVLHAPWGRMTGWGINGDLFGGPMASYYGAIHHKRTFGGFISRARESELFAVGLEPGLRYLACPVSCPDYPAREDLDPEVVQEVFERLRIKYVALHSQTPHGTVTPYTPDQLQKLDRYLRDVAGLTPIETTPSFTVYRNPQVE